MYKFNETDTCSLKGVSIQILYNMNCTLKIATFAYMYNLKRKKKTFVHGGMDGPPSTRSGSLPG